MRDRCKRTDGACVLPRYPEGEIEAQSGQGPGPASHSKAAAGRPPGRYSTAIHPLSTSQGAPSKPWAPLCPGRGRRGFALGGLAGCVGAGATSPGL